MFSIVPSARLAVVMVRGSWHCAHVPESQFVWQEYSPTLESQDAQSDAVVEPGIEFKPVEQGWHVDSALAPTVAEYFPAAQLAQPNAARKYFPATQLAHAPTVLNSRQPLVHALQSPDASD